MLDFVMQWSPVALVALGAMISVLAVLAPLTRSDVDNRLLDKLRTLAALVAKFVGHKAP